MAIMPMRPHVYGVRFRFFCENECFATEIMDVEISRGVEVSAGVRQAAEASVYFNEGIPDLSYSIEFLTPDPIDPGAANCRGAVKPVCSCCGSDTLVRDACVRWDVDTQTWSLSDSYDCTICDLCGSESDDLAKWVPASDVTPLERFTRDLAAKLALSDLAEDYAFQQFCFDHCLTHSVDEAAATWNGAGQPTA